jgi:Peptidase family M20/M25/M40
VEGILRSEAGLTRDVGGAVTSGGKADLSNLTIDPKRLWDSLMETARFGGIEKGGIRRLTLSDEDRQVRDWFKLACEAIGCTVTVNDCGNMFARRAGKRDDLPPICMGSHLDTQPTGGKFDGVLGVLGALEVMRTLHTSSYDTNAPLEIVNWTNEEGSRFAPAMLASGVFAGAFTRDYAYSREDREGKTFAAELERIDYRGHRVGRQAQDRRHVRTAYRARPHPRSGSQDDRRRDRRAGHAVVRGDGQRTPARHRRTCARTRCWGPPA